MLKKMTTFVLAIMAAQTISAQEVKFTFDCRCYDPFNIQKSSNIVYGIRQIEAHDKAMRFFTLDITWRFNEAQKKYRGTGAGESQKKYYP